MRKKEIKNKTKRIEFRCTEEEFNVIKAKAKEASFNKISDFVRERTMNDSKIVLDATNFVESLINWHKEAGRVGNNLNQIAKAINADVKGKGYIQDANAKAMVACMGEYAAMNQTIDHSLKKLLRHASKKKKK
ncbi:uncharacterized protein (DUF1778 family) [Dysgonomonas sp. PH5-45]|uniref:plasmid mobilization protein n=1 Tax=unclassified Dysgonomonas TaxID=2630389 RepID=UPI002476C85B|nr:MULTISPECIES: plasmid mobilization relaxosome protein MobC [unclassified Dysgonomonas]MDH6355539.1 uncharacterized protein (DUF1778 family) [Dysgonomonas sp. PH5-45]MDH6388400.1 uncharacterized protein (DUF1778 family) [Dysgonomonas sp. PH5-37]